ncbi:MAG: enoyl-CoA hydratase-related protein [Fidelibacterota bacterium]
MKYITFEITDFIGVITINRPPVNALNAALLKEINAALFKVKENIKERKLRVLLITGAGENFCVGADLKERLGMSPAEVDSTVHLIRSTFGEISKLPVPVIALVRGSAIGGGLELALAADIRIFSETAKVGLREVKLGVIPGGGGTFRIAVLIGYSNALFLITTGRILNAEESFRMGLANKVVPDDRLLSEGKSIAKEIAENAPLAVQNAKVALQHEIMYQSPGYYGIEALYYRKIIPTRDRIEGLRSFHEKREPVYSGE